MLNLASRQAAVLLLTAKLRVTGIASKRDDTPLHRAADKHLNAMILAVNYGFMRGRKAYKSGGVSAAVKAIRAALLATLPSVLVKVYVAGAEVAVDGLPRFKKLTVINRDGTPATHRHAEIAQDRAPGSSASKMAGQLTPEVGQGSAVLLAPFRTLKPQRPNEPHSTSGDFGLAFNVTDPRAVQWAREHTSQIADDISQTSKDRINNAIADALDGDGIDAAYDDILAAVGDEARADMIARTEIMDAANQGALEGFSAAQDAGLLPENATKEWIATSDCCDECEDLDGEQVGLDEDFSSGDDAPPAHPNCRCSLGIGSSEA